MQRPRELPVHRVLVGRVSLTALLGLLGACGDAGDADSASVASQPSASDSAADTAGETGEATATPTTGSTGSTGSTSAASAETTDTGGPDPSSTGSGAETSDAPTTGDVTAATTQATTSDTDEPGTSSEPASTSTGVVDSTGSDDTASCPEGQDGCPCGQNDACDPGLACMAGTCGPAPKCGDGKIDPGEQCDDGAGNGDTKACKANCSEQICGDGSVGPGEACDDGNQVNGDGCEKTCVASPVGLDACGFAGDGVWFQIDYSNAFSVSNPKYTYSPTPNWQEAEWAPSDKGWPYAVDLFNNAKIHNDQIGTVALLDGTNKAVRVYFGLMGLSSYEYATVCVEGRSYSVGSSVTFTVMEAKTKCQNQGMMANDWSVHATGVDLGTCFLENDDFQAVQVQPSGGSGSLSLKRLRVTLHGAVY